MQNELSSHLQTKLSEDGTFTNIHNTLRQE